MEVEVCDSCLNLSVLSGRQCPGHDGKRSPESHRRLHAGLSLLGGGDT